MNTACCNDHFIHKLKNTEALTQRTISCPLNLAVTIITPMFFPVAPIDLVAIGL